jgi:hypothetical protein
MSREEELKRIEAVLTQIFSSGINKDDLLDQTDTFEYGIPFTRIARPCTIGDGIKVIEPEEFPILEETFAQAVAQGRITKFVPASGAATMMFKSLQAYMNSCDNGESQVPESVLKYGRKFIHSLKRFAFYDALEEVIARDDLNLTELLESGRYSLILKFVLTEKGLNYAKLPKGLIPFHMNSGRPRSAIAEHLIEAAEYTRDNDGVARLHFTVLPEYRDVIETHVNEVCGDLTQQGVRFDVSYSLQKESSRTMAIDRESNPHCTNDTLLVFRPAGHGALLENLSEIGGDIVCIKNIDNVVPDHLKTQTYTYKKVLGGYLLMLQKEIFAALEKLEQDTATPADLKNMSAFIRDEFGITTPDEYGAYTGEQKKKYLFERLNRPIRVCGMVKNLGEPGGGPFWLTGENDNPLQIVESEQVEMDRPDQKAIFESSTHFNPVDLICAVRDYKGRAFRLMHYVDYNLGIISCKSKNGSELRAVELPGLWNGSMAYWNTVFVEVPLITFNPVKTVNDLLREEHQYA